MADIFDLFRRIAKKEPTDRLPISWLIVGLGNTGKQYENTRHNAGFLAIDRIAEHAGIKIDRARFHALTGDGELCGARVLLMKPQTLMNASGLAVHEVADFYKISPDRIIVLSDDISLPVAHLRVRRKGSAGGHNGIKDIIVCLGSEDFPRIRIGIGQKPHPDYDLAAWVLSEFSAADRRRLSAALDVAEIGVKKILAGDFDAAMQDCNSFRPAEDNPA